MKNNNNLIKPTSEYWSDSYDTEKWDMAQEAFKTWYYSKSQGIEPTPPTPIYSSVTTEEIDCFGYDKYKVTTTEYYSGYSQDTLVVYDTEVVNTLIERNSPDCGYVRPISYSSYTDTDIFCSGYTKIETDTTHYLSGYTDVTPIVYNEYSSETTTTFEENSEYCGYVRPISYSSYTDTDITCEDYTKVTTTITHYLSGYTDISPVVYNEYSSKTETEREENSEDCGYVPPVFGNITVTYTDGTTETFTYEGGEIPSEEFYNNKDIVSVTMDENIKIIGENCFKGCTKLTSVTIGDSVEGLGGRAFEGCTKLESITIPSSVGGISEFTFRNCTGLKRVIIEDGITSIGDKAFYGCTSLEYIEIPDSIESIASGAFTNVPTEGTLRCSDDWYDNLTSKNKTNLGNVYHWRMLFDGCKVRLTLSDGSTSSVTFDDCEIPNDYLNNRQDIVKADIGNGITSIKTQAFWYCKQLSSVTIPDSVTDFGVTVFYNIGMDCLYSLNGKFLCQVNPKLTSYDINEGTETIIYGALWKCESITSVTIPDSVTTIKGEAFAYCSSITSIGSKGSGCSIEIPSGVTEFNSGVFAHCTSLTSVTIPDSVTKIGANLFNDCTSLSSVTIPDSVTKILGGAFTSVPTEGTLYCKEDWFNNLSETHKTNLGNLNDWTKVWI